MHYGAFSYTNSKVLFAIKSRERYVITRETCMYQVSNNDKILHISL